MAVCQERSELQMALESYEARINAREYISEDQAMREWEDQVICNGGVTVHPDEEEPATLQSLEARCASIRVQIAELETNLFNVSLTTHADVSTARRGGGSSTTGS